MPRSPSQGPSTALETIYRRHQGLVRWVLRARGVPEVALEDHVHDVFLAMLRRLPERDPAVPMRTWVAGVARNVSFSHRRTAARQRSRALQLVPLEGPPRPDEELERREAWHALSEFLDDLGPEQREVFVMVEVTGMRVAELAESTGLPANTLHSRLKVARTRFSERFAEPHEQRAALLQRAREQGRAEPKERSRTWGMIAASIEGLGAPGATVAGASAKTAWGLGAHTLTAATLAVAVLGTAAIVVSRPRARAEPTAAVTARHVDGDVDRTVVASTSSRPLAPAALTPMAASQPLVPPSPAPARSRSHERSRPERTSAASPIASPPERTDASAPAIDPDAELARTLAAVQRARDELGRGRAREALAVLDAHAAGFGMLERERRRLELDAACRLDDAPRSRRAAAALAELGAAVDLARPCPEPAR